MQVRGQTYSQPLVFTAVFRSLLIGVSTWLLSLSPAFAVDVDYHLGQGLSVGDFNFAGYSNIVGDLPDGSKRKSLTFDDLSLFASGHLNQALNPFVETELTGYTILHGGGPQISNDQVHVVVERLYNDAQLSDNFTLRLGKMLTPVGEWNQIHAAPLVGTTTRPLSTARGFSNYTSGLSLLYASPSSNLPDIQVYYQPDKEILPLPFSEERQYERSEGAHVSWPMGLTDKIGVSFQRTGFVGRGAIQYLGGLNIRQTFGKFTLDGEATYTSLSGQTDKTARSTEGGGYLLGSYALTSAWSVHAWYEYYQKREEPDAIQDVLFGVSFRPLPPLVWKLEYLRNVGNAVDTPNGAYVSFSVLF